MKAGVLQPGEREQAEGKEVRMNKDGN